jgi:hypothetical protein
MGSATQVMRAGLGLLRNMLNINRICAKYFGQSITCVALPTPKVISASTFRTLAFCVRVSRSRGGYICGCNSGALS